MQSLGVQEVPSVYHFHENESDSSTDLSSLVMKFGLSFFLLLAFIATAARISSAEQTYLRQTLNGVIKYIRRDWDRGTYSENMEWCSSLGGKLPILHSRDDLDYLADIVIGRTINGPHLTWLGAKTTGDSSCKWSDGVTVEYFHKWTMSCSGTSCRGCCGLAMWTDADFKSFTVKGCDEKNWQVCVIAENTSTSADKIAYLNDTMNVINETIATLSEKINNLSTSLTSLEDNLRSKVDELISNESSVQDPKHSVITDQIQNIKNATELLKNLQDAQGKKLQELEAKITADLQTSKNQVLKQQNTIEEKLDQMSQKILTEQNERKSLAGLLSKTPGIVQQALTETDILHRRMTLHETYMTNRMMSLKLANESLSRQVSEMTSSIRNLGNEVKSQKTANFNTRSMLYTLVILNIFCLVTTVVILKFDIVSYKNSGFASTARRRLGNSYPLFANRTQVSDSRSRHKMASQENLTTEI